jgi:5-hydroxyisourate hydrolase
MGHLTTHVLDTSTGKPAAGILVELYSNYQAQEKLGEATTNSDGRVDAPLLEGDDFKAGTYTLVFRAENYFKNSANQSSDFLKDIIISFNVASPDQHYHVPLLLSPYGYSTYRGS